MKRKMVVTFAAALVAASCGPASADPTLGSTGIFAFGFCPNGWAAADGATLSIQQNAALYALFGTTFGGNGTTTFNLPKLSLVTAPANGRGGKKLTICIATSGIFPSRT